MELIEQDFLEAMFEDLLREEDEKETYYGPPDCFHDQFSKANSCNMQLPTVSLSSDFYLWGKLVQFSIFHCRCR